MSTNPDAKISAEEAAERIGITPTMLGKLRHLGEGPYFYKIGPKKIVYATSDVEAWLESRRMVKTSGNGPGGRPRKNADAEPQRVGA